VGHVVRIRLGGAGAFEQVHDFGLVDGFFVKTVIVLKTNSPSQDHFTLSCWESIVGVIEHNLRICAQSGGSR